MNKRDVSEHILPTAATMVGVCMTVISIVKVVELTHGPSRIDEYLAVDSLFFLLSAGCSYLSIRARISGKRRTKLEQAADLSFMMGMIAMTAIALLFAFEIV